MNGGLRLCGRPIGIRASVVGWQKSGAVGANLRLMAYRTVYIFVHAVTNQRSRSNW